MLQPEKMRIEAATIPFGRKRMRGEPHHPAEGDRTIPNDVSEWFEPFRRIIRSERPARTRS